jgi:hypothetical protein|tara:strand:- start:224 stop:673 length:450 start_codon:yes stop_codon:yes gene_type:complete
MNNWIYQNQEVDTVSDFPDSTYGFVYKITHLPTGKKYIGKKILFFTRKVKLTKKDLLEFEGVVGRRPAYKLAVKESDWKTYWGSNKEIVELSKTEPDDHWEREILAAAPSKKLLTYYETKFQMIYQVLEKPDEFWNDNILGKFYTKDFQ